MLNSGMPTVMSGCLTGCRCVPEGEEEGDVELARFVPPRPLSVLIDPRSKVPSSSPHHYTCPSHCVLIFQYCLGPEHL